MDADSSAFMGKASEWHSPQRCAPGLGLPSGRKQEVTGIRGLIYSPPGCLLPSRALSPQRPGRPGKEVKASWEPQAVGVPEQSRPA